MVTEFVLLVIGAYLLGSVPTAYLVAKWWRGIDIRRFGSGNVGAANIVAAGSRWSSIIVIVFDLAKGFAPVYVAKEVIGLQQYQQVIVGLVAIAGHNWPVFLRFNGGRGILAALGVVFALAPWLALVLAVVAFAWLPFGQFAFGTLLALFLLPILGWAVPGPFSVQRSLVLTLGFAGILLIAVIRRLTAPRSSTGVPAGELMVNRLLFDRDIRDRKAWISRQPLSAPDSIDEVAGQEKEEGQEPR